MQQKGQNYKVFCPKTTAVSLKPIPIKDLTGSEPNHAGYKQMLHGPKKWNMACDDTILSSFGIEQAPDPCLFLGQKNDKTVTHY